MKKILFAIALVITMSFGAKAQFFGMSDSFFNDWSESDAIRTIGFLPMIPGSHGLETDQPAPLGSGLLVLTALGAGYAVARRKRKE